MVLNGEQAVAVRRISGITDHRRWTDVQQGVQNKH